MEVSALAETQPKQTEENQGQVTSPAKIGEGPKDPFRRRLLKAGVKVLAAELVLGGAKLGADQLINQLFPPKPVVKTPEPPPVQTDIPASEKAINQIDLAEITKKQGNMAIVPLSSKTTETEPYSFTLSFQNLTIVDIVNADTPDGLWVALAMPGDVLQRKTFGNPVTNFDGTKTQPYMYTGYTAWIYMDGRTSVFKGSKASLGNGVSVIKPLLEKGKTMSVSSFVIQLGTLKDLNFKSLELLSQNLGKPNLDRSDQTFKFVGNDIALGS